MAREVVCIAPTRCALGESPLWAAGERALYWLDIGIPSSLLRWDARSNGIRCWPLPELAGGLALDTHERVIVLSQSGVNGFDAIDGALELLAPAPQAMGKLRFNDCGCDPAGRLWTGVMTNDFDTAPAVDGALWRLDQQRRWQRMATGFGCPNTFVWSPDGTTFYTADSNRGCLYAYDFDAARDTLSHPRTLDGQPPGIPDGSAMDRNGCFWNARWGANCVARISPTGQVLETVDIPASLVTSCAFGGEELDQLYVTTATCALSPQQLTQEPLAGGLFRFDTGVPGIAPSRFASTRPA